MKYLIVLNFLLSSSLFAQGMLFQEDMNKTLKGPSFFKLGVGRDGKLREISSEIPFFSMPLDTSARSLANSALISLKSNDQTVNRETIACIGKTEIRNGVLTVIELRTCIQISDSNLLYHRVDLSPAQVAHEKQLIANAVVNYKSYEKVEKYVDDTSREEGHKKLIELNSVVPATKVIER